MKLRDFLLIENVINRLSGSSLFLCIFLFICFKDIQCLINELPAGSVKHNIFFVCVRNLNRKLPIPVRNASCSCSYCMCYTTEWVALSAVCGKMVWEVHGGINMIFTLDAACVADRSRPNRSTLCGVVHIWAEVLCLFKTTCIPIKPFVVCSTCASTVWFQLKLTYYITLKKKALTVISCLLLKGKYWERLEDLFVIRGLWSSTRGHCCEGRLISTNPPPEKINESMPLW